MIEEFKTPSKDQVQEMLIKADSNYKNLPNNILNLMTSVYRLGWVECRETIANAIINKQ